MKSLYERLENHLGKVLIICWLGILLTCILGLIESYNARNPYAFGLFIGLTILVYWGTGVLTCLLKGWGVAK